VTWAGPQWGRVVGMTAVDVIVLVAAILWIGVVVAALVVGIRVTLKLRARRRRIERVLYLLRLPVYVGSPLSRRFRASSRRGPESMNELTKIVASGVKLVSAGRKSAEVSLRRRN
jgi:hypothetical protein